VGPERGAILAHAPAGVFETAGAGRNLQVARRHASRDVVAEIEARIVLADDLRRHIALGALGAGIPVGDDAVRGQCIDCIVDHALDEQAVHQVGIVGVHGKAAKRNTEGARCNASIAARTGRRGVEPTLDKQVNSGLPWITAAIEKLLYRN